MNVSKAQLEEEIKKLIIKAVDLEDTLLSEIFSDTPLFKDGLGLDSIDSLEIGIALKKKYNIKFDYNQNNIKYLYSISTITDFVFNHLENASN